MPRINLLPWRDELRAERRNQFYMAMGAGIAAAGVVTLLGLLLMNNVIDAQGERNSALEAEIAQLDKQIEEIIDLEQKKDRLVARMKIIEELQQSRPEVVHLFEELARTLPDGVYLESVKQVGPRIEIKGSAESNTRVSAFMRNIDKSDWLTRPDLQVVQVTKADERGARTSQFTVFANQIRIKNDEEEQDS